MIMIQQFLNKLFPTKQVFSSNKKLIFHEGAGFTNIKNFMHKALGKPTIFITIWYSGPDIKQCREASTGTEFGTGN